MTSRSVLSQLVPGTALALTLLLQGCSSPPPAQKAAEERAEPAKEPVEAAKPPEPKPEPAKPPAEEAKKAEPAKKAEAPKKADAPKKDLTKPSLFTEQAPATFKVRFETSNGNFVVQVTREWAPKGADRFYNLVKYGFFDESRFFRIVPNFIVQWGIPGDPKVARAWESANIKDDPVVKTNRKGLLTYAKTNMPHTRSTQLFINLKSNEFLDASGFAPFGEVVEGMPVVETLFNGYGERPEQDRITRSGNTYLKGDFPKLDYIKKTAIF